MRPQTVEKISSLAIAVAEVMFDMAFWARRSRCKMASQMQHSEEQSFRAQMDLAPMEQFWVHFWLSWGSFGVIFGRLGGCLEFQGGS